MRNKLLIALLVLAAPFALTSDPFSIFAEDDEPVPSGSRGDSTGTSDVWTSSKATGTSTGPWVNFTNQTSTRLAMIGAVGVNDTREKDIVAADLDRNGWTDVIVVRKVPFSTPGGASDVLLMNEGGVLRDRTSNFAPGFNSTPTDARDVVVVDVNDDAWPDVIIANTFEEQPRLYINKGTSSGVWKGLVDETATRFPTITVDPLQFCAVAAGHPTNDMWYPDLYFANYDPAGQAEDVLLVNNSGLTFSDQTASRVGDRRNSAFGTSTEIHDIDGDGDEDILKISTLFSVPPFNKIGVFILENNGLGSFPTFKEVASSQPYMFTVADFDQDGFKDFYIVDDNQDYITFGPAWNTMSTLTNSPRTANFGGNVKAADIDNDGDMDVGVADIDVDIPGCAREFTMLCNQNGSLFDPWSTDQPWHVSTFDFAFLDINRDGKLDLFLGECGRYTVYIQN